MTNWVMEQIGENSSLIIDTNKFDLNHPIFKEKLVSDHKAKPKFVEAHDNSISSRALQLN